ncbi:S24 family peptidase [Leminorella grimontii]|uniref:S24 family peptidase n=1 Tax=Leminorella grimontii TaxID=82981 RepID=UPI002087B752|nr:S24 family peptidase [Leminorella grimontii]GKX58373.1 transcriptional regulator [Leminorella grimontii]
MNEKRKRDEIRRKKLIELVSKYRSQKAFAEAINKDATYVSRMLYPLEKKNAKRVGDDMVLAIETALGLPRGWMDGISGSDIELPELQPGYRIQVLDIEASAGNGFINDDVVQTIKLIEYTDEQAKLMFSNRPASSIRMVTVCGDSMSGTIAPGDSIFIDVTKNYFSGDGIYVFVFKNTLHVKRLQMMPDHLLVISDNPAYREWKITEENEHLLQVRGKVLLSQSQAYKRHG